MNTHSIREFLRTIHSTYNNLESQHFLEVLSFLQQNRENPSEHLLVAHYQKNTEIVHEGKITSSQFPEPFMYAHVPLGIILRGNVNVIKGSKATKQLHTGDFVGLFETSDWLITKKNREIGHWTLVADEDVEILFFSSVLLTEANKATRTFCDYLTNLAQHDPVSQPITDLPLLDWVASHTTKHRLSKCIIIAHTHLLPNNFPLFRHLSHLVDFGHMFVVEKPYSTVESTLHSCIRSGIEIIPVQIIPGFPYEFAAQKSIAILWQKVLETAKREKIEKILILDDGGDIWLSIPWNELHGIRIAGAEQTQRGITRIIHTTAQLPPVVSVATSGIKKIIEPLFIGLSVVDQLTASNTITMKQRIGIIGLGSIGNAILAALTAAGYVVEVYDAGDSNTSTKSSLDTLINDCDVIIGTTGTDALKGIALERIHGTKVLISASSADVEFSSLLRFASPSTSPFDTITIAIHDGCTMNILNGGYPINFDRKKNATPDDDIVLTRCLLYIGLMQAAELLEKDCAQSGIYSLDIESQRKTLHAWIQNKHDHQQPTHINEKDVERIVTSPSTESQISMPSVWTE